MAEFGVNSSGATTQILLEQWQSEFNIKSGEADMLILDMPDSPVQQTPIVYLTHAAQLSTKELYGSVGVCSISPKLEQMDSKKEDRYMLNPRIFAKNIFSVKPLHPGDDPRLMPYDGYEEAEVTVLQPPKHGTLSKDLSPGNAIIYYPNLDFIGNDKVIFLVNIDGHKIKVVHTIKVRDLKDFNTNPFSGTKYCPSTGWWQITQSDFDSGSQDYAAWQRAGQLSTLLAIASQAFTGFQDLAGSAVGNTIGKGVSTQITLDATAAGHGWYIAPTPLDNTDE